VSRLLVRRADVLLENFRPGVLDRLGFPTATLHEINPGLVILSITGFGHDGPEAQRPGYDQIAQGEAGLMSITGEPGQPTKVGVPIADLLAGMYGVSGVLAALLERHQTGRGRVVRTSLLAAVVGVHAFQGTWWTVAGEVPAATGNHHPSVAPYGLFHTGTSAVQLSVGSERQWQGFAPLARLRAARLAHRARPEAEHAAARVGKREHDPRPETVVDPSPAPLLCQPGGQQLRRPEAVALGAIPPLDTATAATAWFGAVNEVITHWAVSEEPGRLEDAYPTIKALLLRGVQAKGVADAPLRSAHAG